MNIDKMYCDTFDEIALPFSPLDLTEAQLTVEILKDKLDVFNSWSFDQFSKSVNIEQLIFARAKFFDQLLTRLWLYYGLVNNSQSNPVALIAVGGYGRCELHPLSDIDILILSSNPLNKEYEERVGALLRLLWDLHLDIGHSVRSLENCFEEAKSDITIMTNLLEARLITGSDQLLNKLQNELFKNDIWSSKDYFHAKVKEQQLRHTHYHSTSYNLEPDIKNSPGGLRDIQVIQWVALRHFGPTAFKNNADFNYFSLEEVEEFKNCRRFLWRIRFALHSILKRPDNRLLFERQLNIAKMLGYQGDGNKAVEKMMRDYYRVVHNITELNQMLLQLFEESILSDNAQRIEEIDNNFQIKDNLIDIKDNDLFTNNPVMIIQLFSTMLNHNNIIGIHSNTIRQLRTARRKITNLLCYNSQARALFLQLIKHPKGIKKALLPMHRFGILAIYIPGWKQITGMMQFDLFHAYTVDEHTIKLLLEIDSFTSESGKKKHPNSSQVFAQLAKPELLIIAALFHDIAKGRSGDHSELGAGLVAEFCHIHAINSEDTELVCWLVRYHLLMSVTAQRRDLQDPVVIRDFSILVRNKIRLQYLLCLTVADICATNDTLWNSWKQSLMRKLYLSTERSFELGIHHIPEQRSIARQHKNQAREQLIAKGYTEEQIKLFWLDYHFDYFLRYNAEQIVWHTTHLLKHPQNHSLVLVNPQPFYGGTEIFIYSPDRPYLFATVSNELSKKNLNIHDALITTNKKAFALDTFIVLTPNGQAIQPDRFDDIIHSLEKALTQNSYKPSKIKQISSKLNYFSVPTQVNFLSTLSDGKTYMELIALDRPGLLACIGEVFSSLDLSLRSAKIVTIGEHVEDLFVLTNKNNQALDEESCHLLREAIIKAIDNMAHN
ncbi:bifunctional uridylyltransferase/uridylyl-removing protein GlnD [Orbaceae bacterium ac157xtp]